MTGAERDGEAPRPLLAKLGPGLVTGAADDDPSGIGTYSQVGAQFGFALGWTMLFSYPLMVVTMLIASNPHVMGRLVISRPLVVLGWLATAAMTVAGLLFLFG